MHLCFCNSKELYEDAQLLKKNKRYARAFNLLILSLEELSKPVILLNTLRYSKDDTKKLRDFWGSFNNHSDKKIVWTIYGKYLEEIFNINYFKDRYPPSLQPLLEKFKQLCFYVNSFNNRFIKPNDFAKENIEWLNSIIEFSEKRIKSFFVFTLPLVSKSKFIVKFTRELVDSLID